MDSRRLQELFLSSLPNVAFADALQLATMSQISYAMDLCPLQESFRFRTRYVGWGAAHYLIDEKEGLDLGRVDELLAQLEAAPFPLGPKMEGDADVYSHLIHCLTILRERKEIRDWIEKFSPPLCHKKAEEIIGETVWPNEVQRVQTVHVRRAALAAWLTPLRQTTGSCFASAPAILIQRHQPERFFKDLYDLLSTGQLRRTFGGRGYTVPLSPTPGVGDLQKPLPPFSNLADLSYAPGLRIALEAAGVVSPELSLTGKIGEIRKRLDRIDAPVDTVEKLLRELLLGALDLSEQEMEEEENLAKMQMTPLLAKQSAVYYQRPTARGVKVAEFRKKFKTACHVFRSLTECALLRSWEYSIASLCDVKFDFARWNLYVGLGLHPEQKGGIGDLLYRTIDGKLKACNEEAARLHRDYEIAFSNARAAEALLHRSSGEFDRHRAAAEFAAATRAADMALEMRNRTAAMAEAMAQSFPSLIRQFDEKLQENFQEIFDPVVWEGGEVRRDEAALYDDNPAGFRLVYKHGRADASLWTLVHSEDEYLRSLRDFFSSVERDLQLLPPLDADFASEITTGIVQYLAQPEFLSSAIERARREGRFSPWYYVSGGTMQNLVQNYYGREKRLTEVACIAHSAEELMQFLNEVAKGKETPLLIHSPSHAFILRPDWIANERGSFAQNGEAIQRWKLDEERQEYLAHRLSDKLTPVEKPLFLHLFRKRHVAATNAQFRSDLIDSLRALPPVRSRNIEGMVDSLMYENFPLFSPAEAKEALRGLLGSVLDLDPQKIEVESSFMGSWELQQKAKELIAMHNKSAFSSIDWDLKLAQRARELHLSYPAPRLFADTNWSGWFFGWVVNPATAALQLWRLNRTATQGVPMHEWRHFLSSENKFPWIVLSKNDEYGDYF